MVDHRPDQLQGEGSLASHVLFNLCRYHLKSCFSNRYGMGACYPSTCPSVCWRLSSCCSSRRPESIET